MVDVKLVESLVISHIVKDQTYAIVIAQPNLHHQIGAIEIVDICRQSLMVWGLYPAKKSLLGGEWWVVSGEWQTKFSV